MIINKDNPIDKVIKSFFPKDQIEAVSKDNLAFLGINFHKGKTVAKIYYKDSTSRLKYSEANNITLIDYLKERKMINTLEFVNDETHKNLQRFNISLKHKTNQNMLDLFDWFSKNISFFDKYKEQILALTKMKCCEKENFDYCSLYFFGVVCDCDNKIEKFKATWMNPLPDTDYYIDYIKQFGPVELQNVIPKFKKLIANTGGRMYCEGIDYNKDRIEKSKFYVISATNLYDGMIATFKDDEIMVSKIKELEHWNNLHEELYCYGYAICNHPDNSVSINYYFRYK